VQLHREQSRMFDNKLFGTIWIADVTLTPSALPIDPATEMKPR